MPKIRKTLPAELLPEGFVAAVAPGRVLPDAAALDHIARLISVSESSADLCELVKDAVAATGRTGSHTAP